MVWRVGVWTIVMAMGLAGCQPSDSDDPGTTAGDDSSDAGGTVGEDDTDPGTTPSAASYDDQEVQEVLNLPSSPYNYAEPTLPQHFSGAAALRNDPSDNPVSDEGATLGRVLFYDTLLSQNESIACASCHQSGSGFSDRQQFSSGFDGGLTGRNSMSVINIAYYVSGAMFWDERATSAEHQVLLPIQDSVEMGVTLDELVTRVSGEDYYPPLFELAFGDDEVTSERISLALAQFARSIVSYQSRYDEGLELAGGDPALDFSNFTAEENLGKSLYFGGPGPGGGAGCAGCHNNADALPGGQADPSIFQIGEALNIGLVANSADDPGLGAVTGLTQDEGKFKSPSLRNVGLTAPYMHDGSLASLADVVEHYDDGVRNNPNLDPRLETPMGQPQRLNLSQAEKDALVAFLNTLTDETLATDTKFSNPFR